jgi:Asp-tRNA(Asn)/Glu-tRNA(Gln) amidotransferase A subunit family amidase
VTGGGPHPLYRARLRARGQDLAPDNRRASLPASLTPAWASSKALPLRAGLRQEGRAALEHADVLVLPTIGSAAPTLEPEPLVDSKERRQRQRAGLTTACRLASAPAVSLSCGCPAEPLPIGLQSGGKPCAEQPGLHVAYAYQHATTWPGSRPPLEMGASPAIRPSPHGCPCGPMLGRRPDAAPPVPPC